MAESAELQTVYEQDLGRCIADITFLQSGAYDLHYKGADVGAEHVYISPLGSECEGGE